MASGKPPRRTGSKNEPVTIDLEAERNEPVAHDERTKPEELMADEPEPAAPQGDPVESPRKVDGNNIDETVEGTSATRDFSEEGATPSAATNKKDAASASGLVAAGIFGGLVALVGAGALQYAGYLPAMGPAVPQASQNSDALVQRLSALEGRMENLANASPPPDTSELEARLASLDEAVQGVAAAQSSGADTAMLQELQQKLAEMTEAFSAMQSRVEAIAQSVNQAETRLDQRLTAAEQKIEEPRSDVEMARAIALTALKSAIDRGGPFLTELDTLASLASDDQAVSQLQPYASAGVASRAELVRRFPDTADAILDSIRQPEGESGLGQRFLASALSVIKVRPVGNVEGDTPEAIVARMEDKLRNGDLKGAELEWQQLPEAGKSASADFVEMLKTRVEVETIVGAALSDVMNGNR